MIINLSIFIDDLRKSEKYQNYIEAMSDKFSSLITNIDLNITNDQVFESNMNEFLIGLLKEFERFLEIHVT
jgi:hypothetical protein